VGIWCLAGLLGFFLLEKVFAEESKDNEEDKKENSTPEKEIVWDSIQCFMMDVPYHISLKELPGCSFTSQPLNTALIQGGDLLKGHLFLISIFEGWSFTFLEA